MPDGSSRRRTLFAAVAGAVAVILLGGAGLLLDDFLRGQNGAPAAVPTPATNDGLLGEIAALRTSLETSERRLRADLQTALERQREEMQREVARLEGGERARFASLLDAYRNSVLLLRVETTIRVPGVTDPIVFGGFGTGWVADPLGLVITNKHVVQSWKMEPRVQAFLEAHPGAAIETGIDAWPSGQRFLTATGYPERSTGHHSGPDGDLRLVGTAPDEWVAVDLETPHGIALTRVHEFSDADLAVLEIRGGPFTALPVKPDPSVLRELDPVMLLGFPLGDRVLEAGHADVSASLGTIRFVRETVSHTASAFPGNSGGPLLALDGEVVGVLTRAPIVPGAGPAETFSQAIRSDFVHRLLDILRFVRVDPPEGGNVLLLGSDGGMEVTSRRAGRVAEVVRRAGDEVSAGDVVLRLDEADENAAVEAAEAALAQVEASLAAAEADLSRRERLLAVGAASEAEVQELTAARNASRDERDRRLAAHEHARYAADGVVRSPGFGLLFEVAEEGQMLAGGGIAARIGATAHWETFRTPDVARAGRTYLLLARAAKGYEFVGWEDGRTEPGREATVEPGRTLEARFAPVPGTR